MVCLFFTAASLPLWNPYGRAVRVLLRQTIGRKAGTKQAKLEIKGVPPMSPVNDIDNRIAYQKHLPNRQSGTHILPGLNKTKQEMWQVKAYRQEKTTKTPPPNSCAEKNTLRVWLSMCLRYMQTFHLHSVPVSRFHFAYSFTSKPALHSTVIYCILLSTARLR